MRKQLAIFLVNFFLTQVSLFGFNIEMNTSYDYFRGIPDGSWNGNNGALIGVNSNASLNDCIDLQVGGSYGLYNWDGRGNVVFKNPKAVQQIGFLTAGVSSTYGGWQGGIVYDRLFTRHFGIYDLSPSIDQLRFQGGYTFCSEEVGLWGTLELTGSHKTALGIPVRFKTISQMNIFWKHFFENCAQTNLWIGLPYRNSLKFPHGKAGNFIAGFSFRVPLLACLFIDGNGSYMLARSSHGVEQSRNYGANASIGITYVFGNAKWGCKLPYMPVANHSNFFVDSNVNE